MSDRAGGNKQTHLPSYTAGAIHLLLSLEIITINSNILKDLFSHFTQYLIYEMQSFVRPKESLGEQKGSLRLEDAEWTPQIPHPLCPAKLGACQEQPSASSISFLKCHIALS